MLYAHSAVIVRWCNCNCIEQNIWDTCSEFWEERERKKDNVGFWSPMNIQPFSIKNAKPNGVKVQLLSWLPDEAVGGGAGKGRKHGQKVNERRQKEKGGEAWENVRVSAGWRFGGACVYNLLTCFRWEPLRCPSHACWMSWETCEEQFVDKDPSVAFLSTKPSGSAINQAQEHLCRVSISPQGLVVEESDGGLIPGQTYEAQIGHIWQKRRGGRIGAVANYAEGERERRNL